MSNPSSLQGFSDYGGPNEILLGDGKSLHISHTVHIVFPTSTHNLSLSGVLYVPKLQKYVVSVSQLCKSNSVSVEFFPSCFLVKDLCMGASILQGENIHDVYYAPMSKNPQVNVAVSSSIMDWHHRFGHPSAKIIQQILKCHGVCFQPSAFHNFSCTSTNCLFQINLCLVINHYSLYILMCGELLKNLWMVIFTTLSLLISSQSIFGSILSKRSLMFLLFFLNISD